MSFAKRSPPGTQLCGLLVKMSSDSFALALIGCWSRASDGFASDCTALGESEVVQEYAAGSCAAVSGDSCRRAAMATFKVMPHVNVLSHERRAKIRALTSSL